MILVKPPPRQALSREDFQEKAAMVQAMGLVDRRMVAMERVQMTLVAAEPARRAGKAQLTNQRN